MVNSRLSRAQACAAITGRNALQSRALASEGQRGARVSGVSDRQGSGCMFGEAAAVWEHPGRKSSGITSLLRIPNGGRILRLRTLAG